MATQAAALVTIRSRLEGRAGGPSAWIFESSDGEGAAAVLGEIEAEAVALGCPVIAGSWRPGLLRPFGGLLEAVDTLVEAMMPEDPALLQRMHATIANLMPCWQQGLPAAAATGGEADALGKPRPGLQDFVLRGDRTVLHHYFQKRNLAPWTTANLIHFIVDSTSILARAGRAPCLLLEGVDAADGMTLRALQLLSRYGRHAGSPLVLCASGRPLGEEAKRELIGRPGLYPAWEEVSVDEGPPTRYFAEEVDETLEAASVLVPPFRLSEWRELVEEVLRESLPETVENLVTRRLLRRSGNGRFAFVREAGRRAVEKGLAPGLRCRLHLAALDGTQGRDPFLAAYHASISGEIERIHATSLKALEWAWADSAYECARSLAESAVASSGPERTFDPHLLMAMLCYEAEWYHDAERHFQAALESGDERPDGIERVTLEYFLAYNAVFGIGDYDRGQALLKAVLAQYQAQGEDKRREAGYVRNSIAFAMYRSGKLDEAIDVEELLIDTMGSGHADTFLLSIVNLNLGRLYRNVGIPDRAVELFKAGMLSPTSELSPYAQILFYASLGHVHTARGELVAALQTYHHFVDLMRDLQLDGIRDQVLQSLPHRVPRLPMDGSARSDQTFFYIYSSLAAACQSLGLNDRAEAYLAGIDRLGPVLGQDAILAARKLVAEIRPCEEAAGGGSGEFEEAAQATLLRLPGIVYEVARKDRVIPEAVEALAAGKAVAIVRPRSLGAGVCVVDSLVLCDPRNAAVALRVNQEVGGGFLPRASSVLALASAGSLFQDPLDSLPLVQQNATVRPEYRALLSGLEPIRIGVQILFPDFDGSLFELLSGFERRTGLGLLAAVPFHLRLQSMAIDPLRAFTSYLTCSVEHLVLGDRLFGKTHGATAAENLFPLRPRRSRRAVVLGDQGDSFVVRIVSTWGGRYAPSEFLRLRGEVRSILEMCDGRLTVAEICRQLGGEEGSAGFEKKVSSFLRNLWLHGVVYFLPEGLEWRVA
jgi:tetratricopeptide (TPR) repeat protein